MAEAVQVPWPTSALPGKRPGDGRGDLINAYAVDVMGELEIRRTPGLRRILALPGRLRPRGMFATEQRLYYLFDGTLRYRTWDGLDGVITGLVPGTGPASFARNIRPDPQDNAPPDLIMTTNGAAYRVDEVLDNLEPYPDAKATLADDVEFFSGYFIFVQQPNRLIASDLQTTIVPDGSYGYSEVANDPLWRVRAQGNALYAFGTRTIEVWADAGLSPFPLVRQSSIDAGLLGAWAMAGGSNAWGNGIFFVANDFTVRALQGTDAPIISNQDVSADIYFFRDRANEIYAQVYDFEQQAIFSLTTDQWTWEYNAVTKVWHRRDSYGLPYWCGMFATNWRNRWYVQDTKPRKNTDGVTVTCIQTIMVQEYREDDEYLRFRVESAPMKQFPRAMRIPAIDIDMSNALGKLNVPGPTETDPAVMVSWSKDGGATWSRPVARSLGRVGRYAQKITVNGLGRSTSQGLRLRLDVIDPVPAVLRGTIAKATTSRARQVEI